MKFFLFIYITFSLVFNIQSQEINSNFLSLQKEVTEVQTESKIFQQKIELIKNDGKAKFSLVEIDKKENKTQNEYTFNFRDISKDAIKYKIEKDLIVISVPTVAKSKFIEFRKDGRFEKYENVFEIVVRDYEKAKVIIEKLGVIHLNFAAKTPENYPPQDFEMLSQWLISNISGIKNDKFDFLQTFTFDKINPLISTFTTKSSSPKGITEINYKYNLADLNVDNLVIKANGDMLILEIPTKSKLRFVSVTENGKAKNNLSEFEIRSEDLEKVKLWREAIKILVSKAVSVSEKSTPNVEEFKNAIVYMKNAFKLEISDNCDCKINYVEDEKEKKHLFNFFDLDEFSPTFKVSGAEFQVNIKTKGGQNYISSFASDELEKFTSSIQLPHSDLEKFRYMDKAIKTIIKSCQDIYKIEVPSGEIIDRLKWLKVKIPNFKNESTSITQKIIFNDAEPCKLKYAAATNTSGKSKLIEFDIKPYLIDIYNSNIKINGKNVFLMFNAIDKEKVITVVEDGKPGNFANSFSIQIDDIQRAKEVFEVFRTVINDCK